MCIPHCLQIFWTSILKWDIYWTATMLKIIFEKREQSMFAYAIKKIEGAGPLERRR